jgi:hypothetical protein
MSKSTPAPPDYTGAAEKQAASSKENLTTQNFANRPTIYTPFGSQTWQTAATVDPATGQKVTNWTQNNQLTPQAQSALNSQLNITRARSEIGNNMLNRVSQEYGPTMDWNKFSPGGSAVGGGNYYTGKAGDALMQQFTSRMEPLMAQKADAVQTQLRNQGLSPGDEAYDRQMKQLEQEQNDARQSAAAQATQLAGQEGSRMQGMDIGAGGYNTQQRQQQIAEEMQKRGFSLNEINGLLSGQQVGMPNMPSFSQAGQAPATNYMGAAQNQYGAALDAANAQNAGWGNLASMFGNLGGAAIKAWG